MEYFNKIFNNCSEVTLLSLQNEEHLHLSIKKKMEIKIHILFCKCCSNFIKQSHKIDTSIKKYAENLQHNPPFIASEDFKTRLKEKLK